MATQLITKIIPFLKEVFGVTDEPSEKTPEEKFITFLVVLCVVMFVFAMIFAEQAYMQAIDKYEAYQVIDDLEYKLASCRSENDVCHTAIHNQESTP